MMPLLSNAQSGLTILRHPPLDSDPCGPLGTRDPGHHLSRRRGLVTKPGLGGDLCPSDLGRDSWHSKKTGLRVLGF